MKISKATKAYDANAYKRPWIAPVTLDPFNQYDGPDFDNPIKGAFSGFEGEAGELVIEIKVGSAVAFGQASRREGIRGTISFGIVQNDGTLQEVDRKALVEHLVARRAAGHITPIERYRLSAVVNTVIKNGHLRPGDYSDEGVLSQKELIQIMASRGVFEDDRQALFIKDLSPEDWDVILQAKQQFDSNDEDQDEEYAG